MKILRSFPKKWEIKVITIQEAKDLTKLPLEELIGSLMTQEITMTSHQDDEEKKKKSIALKVSTNDKEEKFKKFMKGEKFKGRRFTSRKESQKKEASLNVDKEKNDIICYKCKKPRHVKYDYPLYKSKAKKGKNKAMVAT
ncbi:hypothetical protein AAG906_003327 [Vitis piasezkii]